MWTRTHWTTPWRTPSDFRIRFGSASARLRLLGAESLELVSEPLRWLLPSSTQSCSKDVVAALRLAAAGPRLKGWRPPSFLLPHQVEAARRVAGSLAAMGGALLADAVGLGKTFVALAVATRFRSTAAVVPATLAPQWRRVAGAVGVPVGIATHESLSRGATVPPGQLVIVDEAHRFRNPNTRRYDRLARDVSGHPVLLVTATPVVNRGADLVHLLRLFLPDHALGRFGIRSLEQETSARNYRSLLRASTPLVVARSSEVALPTGTAMPVLHSRDVASAAPAYPEAFPALLNALDALRYPAAGSATGARLLRLHTCARFASSVAALRETLRRHAAFLDRARQAALLGRAPSRGLYRTLFGVGDDLQLHLDVLIPGTSDAPPDVRELEAEAARVRRAAHLADQVARSPSPKSERLLQVLGERGERKTIVFTSALATAHDLAGRLAWRRVAVVGGGKARIASGPIGLEEVLRLFAPLARGERPPSAGTTVRTLITTDLLSEGLDLQDADAVVHYDLPWTPLRLAQRIGRAARLGAAHPSVQVWWFVPPPELEERLRLLNRLERKTEEQLRLAVPVSSGVGRAVSVNRQLDARERFVASLETSNLPRASRPAATRTAVVRGPLAAVVAFRWCDGRVSVPELVAVDGWPLRVVDELERIFTLLQRLASCPASPQPVPLAAHHALRMLIRTRLRDVRAGPGDRQTVRLRRLVLRHARHAGWARDAATIAALDRVLDRLSSGLSVGAAAEVTSLLQEFPNSRALRAWLARLPAAPQGDPTLTVDALLCGDGIGSE